MLLILLPREEMRWNKTNFLITDPKKNEMQLMKGTKVAFIVPLVTHANKLNSQRLVTR